MYREKGLWDDAYRVSSMASFGQTHYIGSCGLMVFAPAHWLLVQSHYQLVLTNFYKGWFFIIS